MNVNSKEMGGVQVETRSGMTVGKVASFDLDGATGRLVSMRVKSRGLAAVMADELIVSWDAIVEITPEKVVVMDGWRPVGSEALAQAVPAVPAPTMMKER